MRRIEEILFRISRRGRDQLEFKRMKVLEDYFLSLSTDDLYRKYIAIKTKLEFRKTFLTLFLATLIISLFTKVWSGFYQLLIAFINNHFGKEMQKNEISLTIEIIIILFVFTIFIIFMIVYSSLKTQQDLNKELLIVERILEKNNKEH